MNIALTIAGSDPSSGAGVQADIRTFSFFNVYGISAVSCLTIQNSCKIKSLFTVPDQVFTEQLDFLTYDIKPAAVKVGILYGQNKIQHVANYLRINGFKEKGFILDPIMESSSGFCIMDDDDISCMKSHLLPLTTLVTPNIPEAEILTGETIKTKEDMMKAAVQIRSLGATNVLVKGGHLKGISSNILYDGKEFKEYSWKRYPKSIHGTGCTLSAVITSCISKGYPMPEAVEIAHSFIKEATKNTLKIGNGMEMLFTIQ